MQMRMSPQPRPGTERIFDPNLSCRHASVLALLYPISSKPFLVLTRRSLDVNAHQGQISFPGGSQEPNESIVDCALRETWEELGVPEGSVTVVGQLSPLFIQRTGFCVFPVVGWCNEHPRFLPARQEVAEVLEVPVEQLLDDNTHGRETWLLHDVPIEVPFYRVGDHKVWGATAMILAELLALVGTLL
jgi:8-oxo-dGTP pyrophosphatase MutT (NUDIX family)